MTMDAMAERIRRGQARHGVFLTRDGRSIIPEED